MVSAGHMQDNFVYFKFEHCAKIKMHKADTKQEQ